MRFGLDFRLETKTKSNHLISIKKKIKLIQKLRFNLDFDFFFLRFVVFRLDWFSFKRPKILLQDVV